MINKNIAGKLNEQFQREISSSYLYLSMSGWCRKAGFDGAANWMRIQAGEEREHAMKIFDYLESQQEQPALAAIEQPAGQFESLQDIFAKALKHEQFITKSIHDLYSAAAEERDYATQGFLQWFVNEQVEEENEAQRIVDRLKMTEGSRGALLYLDKELGKRAKE